MERCSARYGKRFTAQLPLAPPFVHLSEPDQVKEMFRAPPDVLHPGEGAKVLEPLIGANSVILLDESAHMEQRKLMLPAFHGEKMAALSDLMADVAERKVAGLAAQRADRAAPADAGAHARDHPARGVRPRSRAAGSTPCASAWTSMLAFGDRPISMLPPTPRG